MRRKVGRGFARVRVADSPRHGPTVSRLLGLAGRAGVFDDVTRDACGRGGGWLLQFLTRYGSSIYAMISISRLRLLVALNSAEVD